MPVAQSKRRPMLAKLTNRPCILGSQPSARSACFCNARECLSTSSMMPLIPNFSPSKFISFPSLNLTWRVGGAVDVRGKRVVFICIPFCRALGGRELRKSRVARERIENGLNLVFTSVMKRVIIVSVICQVEYTIQQTNSAL